MREVFVEVSGYHTLKKEYEYLRDMDTEGRFKDHQTAGFKNIFLPLIRGRTKVQMMSALIQGVDSHKEQYVSALNSIALLSALLLPVTLELVNMPLDEIKDPTSSRFCHFLAKTIWSSGTGWTQTPTHSLLERTLGLQLCRSHFSLPLLL